jgi:hypothetical protein
MPVARVLLYAIHDRAVMTGQMIAIKPPNKDRLSTKALPIGLARGAANGRFIARTSD